jgi:uncharacterized protein
MADDSRDGLDCRDFMVSAVGASAALAVSTSAASAQNATGSPSSQAAAAAQGAAYTGDVIDGKKVVSALNIDDLEPGRKHLLYFQGVQQVTGQHWWVSVMVAKWARPGKRIMLVSCAHHDEISPVHTVQTLMARLDPADMSSRISRPGCLPPGTGSHGAAITEFRARHRPCRHEPRVA